MTASEEVRPEQLSLSARLRQPRTIIALLIPLIVLVGFGYLNRDQLAKVPGLLLAANPLLLGGAFLVFYLGFPLRGYRWSVLLQRTNFHLRTRDATEILFLSWFVNCLVPAKLGDVYRAYLLKINSPVSLSRTFGTVFIERVLDLFAIVTLGLAAGFVSFRNGLPGDVQVVFAVGIGVVLLLAAGLLTMRNLGRRILTRLPIPHRVLELYDRFEEGVFSSIGVRALPRPVVLTGFIWATEAMRLYLVVQALGLSDVHLGISGAFFVALIASLLTAVPLSPAGLGIVEVGMVGILSAPWAYNVPLPEAAAIALLDRAISVFSIIVLGAVAYAISPRRRGMGVTASAPA